MDALGVGSVLSAGDYKAQADTFGRQADQLAKAAEWAKSQGMLDAATQYQQAANKAYYDGQRASLQAMNLNSQSSVSIGTTNANSPFASGFNTGEYSAGLSASKNESSNTFFLGVNGSVNLAVGGVGQIGLFVNPGLNGSSFGAGVYDSFGKSFGFDPGLSFAAGYTKGNVMENFAGSATNVNLGMNPLPDVGFQGTVVLNDKNQTIGFGGSLGIKGTPALVGPTYSTTFPTTSVTGYVNGKFVFRAKE